MEWNFILDSDNDLLMEEEPYAGWTDSLRKRGKVLYTNILHFAAVTGFSQLCGFIENEEAHQHYLKVSKAIKTEINKLIKYD